jgi:sterol desaturase/sphingolipid hydroxylase (fatty acid hydroxylase superfamily)
MMQSILRFGLFPTLVIGGNALGIWMVETGVAVWQRIGVLMVIIGVVFWAERVIPYAVVWNDNHGDALRDVLHASVNTTLNYLGIWMLPLFASLGLFAGWWPGTWPFWAQVIFAILVLDIGVTLTHYLSHRWLPLWRFHAVHHSVERMYGFNGLMKHPIHQTIETIGGVAPLVLLGIPTPVAAAVIFAVAIQLLLQHANVDYRTGPFKYVFAIAEVHRFHHRKEPGLGDVNFGLFTTLWDHLLGTFYYSPERVAAHELGLGDRETYPRAYGAQLVEPFRPQSNKRDLRAAER